MPNTQPEAVASAIQKAKAKNARLRLLKERNKTTWLSGAITTKN